MIISQPTLAQDDTNKTDKLSVWYRNSYQPANQKQTMFAEPKVQSQHVRVGSLKGTDNFLYYPSYRLGVNSIAPYYYYGGSSAYIRSYYGMGYLRSLSTADLGAYFLTTGLNHVIDKTLDRKKNRRN